MKKLNEKNQLKFTTKNHKYTFKGETFTSVTTFIGRFFEHFNEKEVARKLAKFPINKANKKGVRYWLKDWKERRLHGNQVHNLLEAYIKKEKVPPHSIESWNKALQGMLWFNKIDEITRKNSNPTYHAEIKIFSETYKLAGTIDLLIEHNKYNKPKFVSLIDWKTNKKISKEGYQGKKALGQLRQWQDCNYNKYSLQLQLYAYILETEYGLTPMDLVIVHLKDDEVVPYMIKYDRKLVEKLLEVKTQNEN